MGKLPILPSSVAAWLIGAAAVICALATPVMAQDLEQSIWCAPDLERLFIERDGLGFNEHTVCSTKSWAMEGTTLTTVQDCESVYVDDDGIVTRLDPRTLTLEIIFDGPDKLLLRDGNLPDMTYKRC